TTLLPRRRPPEPPHRNNREVCSATRAFGARCAAAPGAHRLTSRHARAATASILARADLTTLSMRPAVATGSIGGRTLLCARYCAAKRSSRSIRTIHEQPEVNMTSDDAPPDGGNANKPMRQALSAALRRLAEDGDGQSAEMLELVALALIDRALDGDVP